MRDKLKRADQGKFDARARKFDPVELMNTAHQERLDALVPLKNARMAATPFTFYRGSVPLMAADLGRLPRTGMLVQICGDAHVQNLGASGGGPDGKLIFDINDFDETIHAPWEWDVKRMAASLVLAGRDALNSEQQCKDAVLSFGRVYREKMRMFSELPVLELARYQVLRQPKGSPVREVLRKAERTTPHDNLKKLTEHKGSNYNLKRIDDPVYGIRVQDGVKRITVPKVLAALSAYTETLQPERRYFFAAYKPACLDIEWWEQAALGYETTLCCCSAARPRTRCFCNSSKSWPPLMRLIFRKMLPPSTTGKEWLRACERCWSKPTSFSDGRP